MRALSFRARLAYLRLRRAVARRPAAWGALAAALLVVYFGYHALHGRFGLFAWADLSREIADVRHELEEVRAERMALEARVAQLQPDSSDPDLLEEQVRRSLGYLREDEVIILLDDEWR
jgi:cell division protein FtsB